MLESCLEKALCDMLLGRTVYRGPEGIHLFLVLALRPLRGEIDEVLDVPDRLQIEGGDARRELVDKAVELTVGKGPIDVSVLFGERSVEVEAAEEDLEGPAPPDQGRQT
ncbi:hypothetical protein AB4212_05535 [Streptomyces sp. 2MCAF27]